MKRLSRSAKPKANPSKPYSPMVSTRKPSKPLFQKPSSLTNPTLSSSSPVTPYTLTSPPLSFPTSLNSDISIALPSTSSKPITPIQSHSTLSFLGSPGLANPDPFSSSLTLLRHLGLEPDVFTLNSLVKRVKFWRKTRLPMEFV